MKEFYVTGYDFACITGRPLPDVLAGMRNGDIPVHMVDGERLIPLSYFYPEVFDDMDEDE